MASSDAADVDVAVVVDEDDEVVLDETAGEEVGGGPLMSTVMVTNLVSVACV